MILPSQLAETWLASRFTAVQASLISAGCTGVHAHPAPEDATEPYVTVQLISAADISPIGRGMPAIGKLTYAVSAWDIGDRTDRVRAIAAVVDGALRDVAPVAVTGGSILHCIPRGEVPAPKSIEAGQAYRRAGQQWEFLVQVQP